MTFGRALLPLWPLDPDATYLNHGTVGVTPRRVLDAQQRLRDHIERHPSRFLLRELWTFAGEARFGADPDAAGRGRCRRIRGRER